MKKRPTVLITVTYDSDSCPLNAAPKDPCKNAMQLQNPPCTAQVAGHPSMQSDPTTDA